MRGNTMFSIHLPTGGTLRSSTSVIILYQSHFPPRRAVKGRLHKLYLLRTSRLTDWATRAQIKGQRGTKKHMKKGQRLQKGAKHMNNDRGGTKGGGGGTFGMDHASCYS